MASSPPSQASSSSPSSTDTLTGLPKDPSRSPPTPPPAYFPRLNTMSAHLAARWAGLQREAMLPPQHPVNVPAAVASRPAHDYYDDNNYYGVEDEDDEDDEDENDNDNSSSSRSTAITVRISTAVRVSGDRNVVCFRATPEDNARLVASAVTRSIRGGGDDAVPMIDEEGRPRRLRIEIEAGVEIHGEGNVLGGEDVVLKAVRAKRKRVEEEQEEAAAGVRRRLGRRRARSASA